MADEGDRAGAGFLGKGWAFPPAFDAATGEVRMVERETDVLESLRILFQTRPGERIMHPTYGCRLHDLVFEPIDGETEAAAEVAIREAILFFEPRIRLNAVTVDGSDWLEGRMKVEIDYALRETNARHNVVFPFYIGEGTLLAGDPLPGV